MNLLDTILDKGSGLFTAFQASEAQKAALKNAKLNQSAAQANSSGLVKLALIGGAVLAVVAVLALVFRGRG